MIFVVKVYFYPPSFDYAAEKGVTGATGIPGVTGATGIPGATGAGLDGVQLKNKARSYPSELSGGEQQRVAIARAIVNSPELLIADEPTGNLDPDTSWGIMDVLDEINHRGTTILMATHNKDIVNTIKKRVIAIESGRIVRDEVRGNYGYEA